MKVCVSTNLTVEAKQQQHNEEKNCPECRNRHHGYSFGVGNERQAWTYRGIVRCGGVVRADREVWGERTLVSYDKLV